MTGFLTSIGGTSMILGPSGALFVFPSIEDPRVGAGTPDGRRLRVSRLCRPSYLCIALALSCTAVLALSVALLAAMSAACMWYLSCRGDASVC